MIPCLRGKQASSTSVVAPSSKFTGGKKLNTKDACTAYKIWYLYNEIIQSGLILTVFEIIGGGNPPRAINFGLRIMCHQKDPTFFRSLSPKDPHFYQLSPKDPLFLTNSLSPKDSDTSLSLKDPSFSYLIVKLLRIFGKKIGFFENLTKFDEMLRNFWPFWPKKPLFFDAFL